MTSLTPFWSLYFMMPLHISHVIVESYCWFWAGKCLLGAHVTNLIYPTAEWRHRSTVFIFNFEHISHLVPIVNFEHVFNCQVWYRFFAFRKGFHELECTPIASSSKQDIFITNFNANLFYLLKNEIN